MVCAEYRIHPEVLAEREHTITVVVDDGTDQVEDSFVIIVKKEGSPRPGLVVALAAVVLVGLAMVRRRGQRQARWRPSRSPSA